MKLIIAGGRDFDDAEKFLRAYSLFENVTEIVCGKARGADTLGEILGRLLGIPIKEFPADWDAYGKSAGHRRNAEMATYADEALIFWDRDSRGTKGMIDQMKRVGKPYTVEYYT